MNMIDNIQSFPGDSVIERSIVYQSPVESVGVEASKHNLRYLHLD